MKKEELVFFNGFYLPHLGGVERYTSKIIEKLKDKYDITIVTTNHDNGKSIEYIDGIKIYRLPTYKPLKNRFPILKLNSEYYKLMRHIKKHNFKYVICNTRYYFTTILGCKIAKKNRIRPIIIDHSSGYITMGNSIINFLLKIYEHLITKIIKCYKPSFYGVSGRCNEWLKKYKISADGVLYNSVDEKEYDKYHSFTGNTNNGNIKILFVGRIIKEKGIVNLLKAFNMLSEKHSNISLYVAGDGPLLTILREKYNSSKITFLGKINHDEVMKLCDETDIFVSPSMYPEGLPTSILEAGLMKNAIVATDRGGTIEVIENNNLGIIVEENVPDLVQKLELLIIDSKLLEELKENIHKHIISNFTWEVTADKIYKMLEKY